MLLIDADLRRPRLREMFALPASEGLTDSLTLPRGGRLPVHQVTPTLWVLTAGRAVPDPMSLLVSPAMKQLLDDARDAFDWVVVDTPPIAILPDANLLAAMIDTALLVVSARVDAVPDGAARGRRRSAPTRILGVVLNRAEHAGAAGELRLLRLQARISRCHAAQPRCRTRSGSGGSASPTEACRHVQ